LKWILEWLPAISVLVALFAAFVTYRSYLANQRFAEANHKPILKVKSTTQFTDYWGVLFENELNRYCFIESAYFTDGRVECVYEGNMLLVKGNSMIQRSGQPKTTEDTGPFVKLTAQTNEEISGKIVLKVESFLGDKYELSTSDIIFNNMNIKNQNRIWLEYLKVEKI
jgi:hypothetical protein